ncbi:MAG: hypothetical protein GEV06_09275 [Luteitalea sp.]|nr:hypothetical protein [Luteitalea sp.]
MPFLRILRDKRGIEHLSLCQPGRDGDHGRPRVLYWFRSSSAAKGAGRSPLDEASRREIERHFPDVTFDWQALWQTVTTATLPELAGPAAKAGSAAPSAAVADLDVSRAARGSADQSERRGRPDQGARGAEQRGADQDPARARRNARARRRPRSARRRAAMEVSPASEVSE